MSFASRISAQIRPVLTAALISVIVGSSPALAAGQDRPLGQVEPVRCYVDADATGDNNGSSWQDAYQDLQSILGVPPIFSQCSEVWVAEGTYKPGSSRDDSFLLNRAIEIFGGFSGTETLLSQRDPAVHVTVLSGDIGIQEDSSDNSYHVVKTSDPANAMRLDGFTITGGNADTGSSTTEVSGGGIHIYQARPVLANLVITGNTALMNGAGLYNHAGAPTLANVVFSGNHGTVNNSAGGGMYNYYPPESGPPSYLPSLTNVTFTGNSADAGGGMYSERMNAALEHVTFTGNTAELGAGMYNIYANPILTDVLFSANTATNSGGGMFNTNSSSPSLTQVVFDGNSAESLGYGGGMLNYTDSNPTLSRVTFHNNSAADGAGLLNSYSSPTLTDVAFDGNAAQYAGGAVYNLNSSMNLKKATFSANSAELGGALYNQDSVPLLENDTFAANTAALKGGAIYNTNSSPVMKHITASGNVAAQGGGMFSDNASYPSVSNSIFYGDGGEEIHNGTVSAAQLSYSIIAGGCPGGSICTAVTGADPRLGTLKNNGGFAQTRAPGAGSAAIDAGSAAACAATDERGVARPQGAGCDIGAYEVRARSFVSAASYDGWILESSETSGTGGSINSTATTLRAGDDASNRQIRSILSFNTASLPDGAAVVLAKVQLRKQAITGDPNPFRTHGALLTDLARPSFGAGVGLAASDFQAAARVSAAGRLASAPAGSLYSLLLSSAGRAGLNRTGTTQFRLRFAADDDNDHLTDYLSFFSGNYLATPAYRPKLIVYYNP